MLVAAAWVLYAEFAKGRPSQEERGVCEFAACFTAWP